MSELNYVDVLKNAATSLAEEGRNNQADILLEAAAELADMKEQMEVMKGAKEVIARLRAEHLVALKANTDVAGMNVSLQIEIISLRAELETEKAGAILLENELNRQLTKKDAELDEARRVIEPFAEQGNVPNDFSLPDTDLVCQVRYSDCKAASAYLAAHPESGLSSGVLEHEWHCPSPCNHKHGRYVNTCQVCGFTRRYLAARPEATK